MKTICDRCCNYEVTQSGVTEICHAKKENSRIVGQNVITDDYTELRMSGEKKHCKQFKKI